MAMVLDVIEARVLGSLLEKERTVPATYPLTLNALLSACNQSSGREPVLNVTEAQAEAAITSLKERRLLRRVLPSHGSRTVKYRHVAEAELELDGAERAMVTLLLLRGPQTSGELRARSDRLHAFGPLDEVDAALDRLAGRPEPMVQRLDRRSGQKEVRWATTLVATPSSDASGEPPAIAPGSVATIAPEVAPLAAMVGVWEGTGQGHYPTIESFRYTERIELSPVLGKALLSYRSVTRSADDGRALHGEAGWLRLVDGDTVELVVAQGPGLVELAEGLIEPEPDSDGSSLELVLASTMVAGTTTAKDVTSIERRYRAGGDSLTYELAMAAVGQPLTHHLSGRLHRVER